MITRIRSLIKDTRANVLIESAFALPIFIVCTLAIIELGRALVTLYFMQDAAASGARYAMVRGSESESPASPQDIEAVVRAQMQMDHSRLGVTIQLVDDNGTVSNVPGGYYFDPGDTIRVVTDYDFEFIVPVISDKSFSFVQFMDAVVMY